MAAIRAAGEVLPVLYSGDEIRGEVLAYWL